MIFVHHPLTTLGTFYLGLVGIVVQLDAGVVLVALVPVASLGVGYFLSKRERRNIRQENATYAKEAAEAAAAAAAAQDEVKSKVEEVHVLANSAKAALEEQKRGLETQLAAAELRITRLEDLLAASAPPIARLTEGAP